MFFDQRLPVPKTMLCLRLVSKRCYDIATRYAWEMFDSISRPEYLLERNERCRDSFHVIEFFVLNPHLAGRIRVLNLDFQSLDESQSGFDPNHAEAILERFFRCTTSLNVCAMSGAVALSVAARSIFSIPSLRAFIDKGGNGGEIRDYRDDLRDFDLSHLEAIYVEGCYEVPSPLRHPLSLKALSMQCYFNNYKHTNWLSTRLLPSTLATLEELEFVVDMNHLSQYICETFEVCFTLHLHFASFDIDSTRSKDLCTAGRSVCLRELHVECQERSPYIAGLSQLLGAFRGADLRKLVITGFSKLKDDDVKKACMTFPNLESLAFFLCGLEGSRVIRLTKIVRAIVFRLLFLPITGCSSTSRKRSATQST